ncbi:MAG: VOC family protein [Saprospiraceae bacterium]|nr:VOC family protein [Saprospiraceae bacterium]
MTYTIHGIQHLGVGVPDHGSSWKWYRQFFGLDIPLFDDEAEAHLMTAYTNGKVISKRAAMVLNLKGGCAMEVVSPSTFTASHADVEHQLGDLGIYIGWIKAPDVKEVYSHYQCSGVQIVSELMQMPNGWTTFYLKDPNGLLFQVVPDPNVYTKSSHLTGGTSGCSIGVSDIDRAKHFYGILGYDQVIYDESNRFADWSKLRGGKGKFRRLLLGQSNPSGGGFSKLTGKTYIELVQDLSGRKPVKIYEGRRWGDIGFVHLGFDIRNMPGLGEKLSSIGHGFTCDTKDVLSMGASTKVHCTYTEDPDGTLIEMIEVYKMPIVEKLGIFLNVERRKPTQPLPDLMLKALRFMRVRD